MRVDIVTKGDFRNITNWLNGVKDKSPTLVLRDIGREGVESLSRATPIGETGETAMGWDYTIDGSEVAWINRAHPEAAVNIAKIIQTGHGTGTGGYVPPYDYITPAMEMVYRRASERIQREMIK